MRTVYRCSTEFLCYAQIPDTSADYSSNDLDMTTCVKLGIFSFFNVLLLPDADRWTNITIVPLDF